MPSHGVCLSGVVSRAVRDEAVRGQRADAGGALAQLVQLIFSRQTLYDAIDDLGDRIKLGVVLAARPSANLKAGAG